MGSAFGFQNGTANFKTVWSALKPSDSFKRVRISNWSVTYTPTQLCRYTYVYTSVCLSYIGGKVLAHESADYHRVYQASLDYPEVFWSSLAKKLLTWRESAFETIDSCDFSKGRIEWFKGGILNASGNQHILLL